MKSPTLKTTFLVTAFLVAISLTSHVSAQPAAAHLNLVLLSDVNVSSLSSFVQLQSKDPSDSCRYFGKVEDRKGIKESAAMQLLRQATSGASTFSIAIQRKVCGTTENTVKLRVPLNNLATGLEYPQGTVVQAIEDK